MEHTKENGMSGRRRRGAWRVALAALLLSTFVGGFAVAAEEQGRVDINTATAAELESLPGVGPRRRRRSSRTARWRRSRTPTSSSR